MNKRILVTGAGGFIGHHFVQYVLEKTGWDVIVFYRNNTKRIPPSDRVECIKVDLSQKIDLDIGKIDYVVHMASETYVDDSLKDCISFVKSNVLGTANLLEWLKKNHRKTKVCVFSSDEVMGPAEEGIYFKENDLRKPSNPYAATKAGAELLAYSFVRSFDMPIFTIRCMNVLGEGESFEKFIPKTFKSIKEGKKIILHGTSIENVASRHWIYAKDVAAAVLFLLKKASPKEIYHIAGEERDVYSLAKMIYFSVKRQDMPIDAVEFVDFHNARPGHDKRYSLSNEKLLKMGWRPKWNLNNCIENVVKDLEKKYKQGKNLL